MDILVNISVGKVSLKDGRVIFDNGEKKPATPELLNDPDVVYAMERKWLRLDSVGSLADAANVLTQESSIKVTVPEVFKGTTEYPGKPVESVEVEPVEPKPRRAKKAE